MQLFAFFKGTHHQEPELTISDEVMDEPPEDFKVSSSILEDSSDTLMDSFDIISDEEVARVKQPFYTTAPPPTTAWSPLPPIMTPTSSSATLISKRGSCSSLSSTGTDAGSEIIPSVISRKGLSFLFRNRNMTAVCQAQLQLLQPPVKKVPPQLTEEEMTSSTTRIWYIIQLQGHYNHGLEETEEEEEGWYLHKNPKTMENSSEKRTNWISSILHLPEKIKQHQADKNRFNIHAISPQAKEELKHLYVY